jgi:hypothetical protein
MKFMKKNLKTIILFLITLNSTLCIESKDFCSLRQNEQECHGLFSFKCKSSVCTSNNISCTEYIQMKSYIKYLKNKPVDLELANKYLKESNKKRIFNKHIKKCDYRFEANDFCLNRIICYEKRMSATGFGFKYINFRVNCKCPSKQSFKCDQFCTVHSDACDYYKSNSNISKHFTKCLKQHVKFGSFFSIS